MGLIRVPATLGALLLLAPASLAAQAVVRSAHLTVDLRQGDGGAVVTVEYDLSDESVVEDLTVELLGFDDATAEEVVVDGGGRVVLWPASGSRRSATVSLPTTGSTDGRTVTFDYRVASAVVEEAGVVEARIPIVSVSVPPETEAGDVFHALVAVPEDWNVIEGFPTGLSEVSPGVYSVDLPVVPALVSLRGRTDGARTLGLGLVIDVLMALILLAFGFVGWRHLRRVAA